MARRVIVQTLVWYGVMGLLLFVPAGTVYWPGAWAFLAEMMGLSAVTGLLLAHHDPALLAERLGSPVQKGQPTADKLLLIAILLSLGGWLVFMGIDARFGWSVVPVWAQALGALCVAVGLWTGYRAMRENSFAAPVVKIQKERGQRVIDTGPYSYVRHPLYAGALFFFLGVPLLLRSWWGPRADAGVPSAAGGAYSARGKDSALWIGGIRCLRRAGALPAGAADLVDLEMVANSLRPRECPVVNSISG